MPFTFSHPALVLPLSFLPRHWFSMTGLIIGSLTPDFEYFLRMKIQSDYSHTLSGLFWFDLPLGILLTFIFHNIVRDSLFDNLPSTLYTRFASFKKFDWNYYFTRNWFVVIISIIIGAASHIFWDSFTHFDGYFVQTIPDLSKSTDIYGIKIQVLKILQHSSTISGGLIVSFAILKLKQDKNVINHPNIKYWIIWSTLSFIIITLRLYSGLDYKLYGHLIVTAISAGLISLIFTPWIIKRLNR